MTVEPELASTIDLEAVEGSPRSMFSAIEPVSPFGNETHSEKRVAVTWKRLNIVSRMGCKHLCVNSNIFVSKRVQFRWYFHQWQQWQVVGIEIL